MWEEEDWGLSASKCIPPAVDGRWTVYAWAPVDGRAINRVARRVLMIDASLDPADSW
jgi:hypothetical protein